MANSTSCQKMKRLQKPFSSFSFTTPTHYNQKRKDTARKNTFFVLPPYPNSLLSIQDSAYIAFIKRLFRRKYERDFVDVVCFPWHAWVFCFSEAEEIRYNHIRSICRLFHAGNTGAANWAVVQWQDSGFWYQLSRFESLQPSHIPFSNPPRAGFVLA